MFYLKSFPINFSQTMIKKSDWKIPNRFFFIIVDYTKLFHSFFNGSV